MSKFKAGQEVIFSKGNQKDVKGVVYIPSYQVSQSDWPEVIVEYGGGWRVFVDIDDVRPAEDPYEYAVEWTVKGSDVPRPILADRWVTRDSAERTIEFNERMFPDKMQVYTVRLVKRRKAGPVEDV